MANWLFAIRWHAGPCGSGRYPKPPLRARECSRNGLPCSGITSPCPAGVATNASPTAGQRGCCRARAQPAHQAAFSVQHYFTVNFSHENQKALELRTEDAKDCDEWVAAIAHARYVSPRCRQKGWAQGAVLGKPKPQQERARHGGREEGMEDRQGPPERPGARGRERLPSAVGVSPASGAPSGCRPQRLTRRARGPQLPDAGHRARITDAEAPAPAADRGDGEDRGQAAAAADRGRGGGDRAAEGRGDPGPTPHRSGGTRRAGGPPPATALPASRSKVSDAGGWGAGSQIWVQTPPLHPRTAAEQPPTSLCSRSSQALYS